MYSKTLKTSSQYTELQIFWNVCYEDYKLKIYQMEKFTVDPIYILKVEYNG